MDYTILKRLLKLYDCPFSKKEIYQQIILMTIEKFGNSSLAKRPNLLY